MAVAAQLVARYVQLEALELVGTDQEAPRHFDGIIGSAQCLHRS